MRPAVALRLHDWRVCKHQRWGGRGVQAERDSALADLCIFGHHAPGPVEYDGFIFIKGAKLLDMHAQLAIPLVE